MALTNIFVLPFFMNIYCIHEFNDIQEAVFFLINHIFIDLISRKNFLPELWLTRVKYLLNNNVHCFINKIIFWKYM